MRTESTVRPELVEFYPSMVRVNYDVVEDTRIDDMDGTETTFYVYEMLELHNTSFNDLTLMGVDKLTKALVESRYSLEEQVEMLTSGNVSAVSAIKVWRADCKKIARSILGCPVTNESEKEKRQNYIDKVNAATDAKILTGFVWRAKNVYLSSENQFNFKAAYDLAVMSGGQTLPVKFKLGEDGDGNPVYHTFTELSEFTDFYTSALAFVNETLNEGWNEKDSVDYDELEVKSEN